MDRELDFDEAPALEPDRPRASPAMTWHLPLVGSLALVWSAICSMDFLATLTRFPPYTNLLPEPLRDALFSLPAGAYLLWGAAVAAGAAGAVMLFRRQAAAVRVLAVAATTTIISMAVNHSSLSAHEVSNPVFSAFVIVVSLLLLYYAMIQAKRGALT
jgi:hypothetical protein